MEKKTKILILLIFLKSLFFAIISLISVILLIFILQPIYYKYPLDETINRFIILLMLSYFIVLLVTKLYNIFNSIWESTTKNLIINDIIKQTENKFDIKIKYNRIKKEES